jgi:hypothetical protein
MLNPASSTPSPPADDREVRVQALLGQLRPHAEHVLRRIAERLADLPEDQAFGQVEYDLRDLSHQLAAASHQAGLQAGKKRATKAPASSAPAAGPTPASSATGPRPG